MADDKKQEPHEIVLIRRRNDLDQEEHHGGVWKVAFADFMTAMMAFFLVLWIVNSTTKQTRSSLARYFNPVRLSDTTPARKGLRDPREEEFDASADAASQTAGRPGVEPATEPRRADARAPNESAGPVKAQMTQAASRTAPQGRFADVVGRPIVAGDGESSVAFEHRAKDDLQAERNRTAQDANLLRDDLARALGAEEAARLGDALDVSVEADGLLISLTDRMDFGMFSVGSADPEPRLIRALAAIGSVIRGRNGAVVIRGHTDARPYRSRISDNWRLSTARAQSAFAIILNSGLDERRIEKIEGYADRRLKRPEAPDAPENRRIEILIRKTAT